MIAQVQVERPAEEGMPASVADVQTVSVQVPRRANVGSPRDKSQGAQCLGDFVCWLVCNGCSAVVCAYQLIQATEEQFDWQRPERILHACFRCAVWLHGACAIGQVPDKGR